MSKTFRANDEDVLDWNDGEDQIRQTIKQARKAARQARKDSRGERLRELEQVED